MSDNVVFSSDPSKDLQSFLADRKYSKVCVLTDTNTVELELGRKNVGLDLLMARLGLGGGGIS